MIILFAACIGPGFNAGVKDAGTGDSSDTVAASLTMMNSTGEPVDVYLGPADASGHIVTSNLESGVTTFEDVEAGDYIWTVFGDSGCTVSETQTVADGESLTWEATTLDGTGSPPTCEVE